MTLDCSGDGVAFEGKSSEHSLAEREESRVNLLVRLSHPEGSVGDTMG